MVVFGNTIVPSSVRLLVNGCNIYAIVGRVESLNAYSIITRHCLSDNLVVPTTDDLKHGARPIHTACGTMLANLVQLSCTLIADDGIDVTDSVDVSQSVAHSLHVRDACVNQLPDDSTRWEYCTTSQHGARGRSRSTQQEFSGLPTCSTLLTLVQLQKFYMAQ